MTSRELKSQLPEDDRQVFVWIDVDGNWVLKQVQTLEIHEGGGITLEIA